MSNIFNYIFNIQVKANNVVAEMEHLDIAVKNVVNNGNTFNNTIAKMGNAVSRIKMSSAIDQVNRVADAMSSISAPGLELSTSLADLSALTGVAGGDLEALGAKAKASSVEFGTNASASLETYKSILSRLGPDIAKNQDALSGMERNAQILSKTMGGDSAGAADALTTAMLQFGVDLSDPMSATSEMTKMMDVMANAAQEGAAEVPDIAAALKVSGVAMKQAKVSFIEGNAAIQALAQGGKSGAEAGVALRNVLGKMAGVDVIPKEAADKLKGLGVNMSIVSNTSLPLADRLRELRKAQGDATIMAQMFGVENAAAANILIGSIGAQESMADKIGKVGGAMEQAAIVMGSPAEKAKKLQARVDALKLSLFNASGGMLGYANVIGNVGRDLANLAPIYDVLSGAVGGARKAVEFLTNAEKMKAFWDGVVATATYTWAGAQAVLNAIMYANPIALIIIGIAALITLVYQAVKHYDSWGAAILGLMGPFGWLISIIVQLYKHWQDIKNAFKAGGILEGLRALGNTLLRSVLDPIKQILSVMTDLPFGIGNVAQSAIDGINKIEGRMDARDSHNRYLVAVQETKEKIKAADHQKYLDALQETKDKIAGNNKIAPAGGVPGASTGALGGGGGGRSGGAGSRANEAIATGGTKSTVVNVTIQRMLDGFKIMVNDTKEGISGLEDRVIEAVTRAVAAGASLGAS